MRLITFLVLIAGSLLAVEIQPVATVPSDYKINRLFYDSQGNLWISGIANGPDGAMQSVVSLVEDGQIKNPLLNQVSTGHLPKRKFWEPEKSIEWTDVYSRDKTVYLQSELGPDFAIPWPAGRPPQTYFDKVEGGTGSRICTSIGSNFGPLPIGRMSGGWVGADKETYFIAGNRRPNGLPSDFPFDEEYSLYKLTFSGNLGSACNFERVHSLEKEYRVLQAWKMPDGRFLTERYRFPAIKVATEVGIIGLDGKFSPLQIGGEECCQMLVNPSDISAATSNKNGGKNFVRSFRNGRLAGLYELQGFNNSEPVWLSGLNGPWAVFTGAGLARQNQDTIVLLNTLTGIQKPVVSDGQLAGITVKDLDMAQVAVSPTGEVSFVLKKDSSTVIYKEKMSAVLPSIVSLSVNTARVSFGETVTIGWKSVDAIAVRLYAGSNILAENLPLDGTFTTVPQVSTDYKIEAMNFAGSAISSVSVEVVTSNTTKPEYGVQSFASPFFHSLEKSEPGCREFSPGAIMSLYGANLSTGGTVNYSSLYLPTILAGASVFVNGVRVPLYFVSPSQTNFQVPSVTGQVKLWVEVAGIKGPEVSILVKETSPCFLRLPNGDPYFTETGGVRTYYATGLGKTDPIIEAGSPAPTDALFKTLFIPNSIAGTPVNTLFSGLTPGFIGLYQVNATIVP